MDRANRIANGLRGLGLKSGDRVVLLFDNSQELLELIVGTIVSGGVVVPLSGLMMTRGGRLPNDEGIWSEASSSLKGASSALRVRVR